MSNIEIGLNNGKNFSFPNCSKINIKGDYLIVYYYKHYLCNSGLKRKRCQFKCNLSTIDTFKIDDFEYDVFY